MTDQLPIEMNQQLDIFKINKAVSREQIMAAQEYIGSQEQVDLEIVNYHAGGVYGRKMLIPAGVILVGKIHKHESINILLKGTIAVATETGIELLHAPHTFIAPAGVKRVGQAVTDTEWICFHGTHETNLEKIEEEFIAQSYEEYDEFKEGQLNLEHSKEARKCLGEQ